MKVHHWMWLAVGVVALWFLWGKGVFGAMAPKMPNGNPIGPNFLNNG